MFRSSSYCNTPAKSASASYNRQKHRAVVTKYKIIAFSYTSCVFLSATLQIVFSSLNIKCWVVDIKLVGMYEDDTFFQTSSNQVTGSHR